MATLRPALLLLLALVLAGCADPVAQDPAGGASEGASDGTEAGDLPAPPEDSFSPLASLSPSTVEPGDSSTEIHITAADRELASGTYFRVERWDGAGWQLQHHVHHGEVVPPDVGAFEDDGYGIDPGESLTEELPLEGLEVGTHRVGLEMRAMGGGGPTGGGPIPVFARLDVQQRRPGSPTVEGGELDGTEWRSTVVEGLDLPAAQRIALTFRDGRVGAEVACNGFGGPYEIVDGRLVVDEEEFAGTLIGCPEPEGSWDDWLTDLLLADPAVVLDDQGLTLSAGEDTVVFDRYVEPTPTPTDPDAPLSSWIPPPDHRYTISGSCNAARFFGEQVVTVRDGVPSSPDAHLPTLIADAEAVRAGEHDVVRVEHDPLSGHPTAISWDVDRGSSTDSEVCYAVTDFEVLTPTPTEGPTGPLPISTGEPCPPDAACGASVLIDGRSYEPTCGLVDPAVVTAEVHATGAGYTVNVIDGVDPAVLLAWDAPEHCGPPLEGRWHGMIATGVIGSGAYDDAWCRASLNGPDPAEGFTC